MDIAILLVVGLEPLCLNFLSLIDGLIICVDRSKCSGSRLISVHFVKPIEK